MPAVRVISNAAELRAGGAPVAVAMGMFDGVHLGHQHVIRSALLNARRLGGLGVAISFHPHPLTVVNPDRSPEYLQSVNQRLRALGALGLDAVLLIRFDVEFSRVGGAEFVRSLARDFGTLRSFTVGQGFHFGHGRSGNVPLLKALGTELGFATHAKASLSIGDELVSSTRIRRALRAGELDLVSELLGRPYALEGVVVRGRQLGRQLGFPTANLDVRGLALPPAGVYAARARWDGQERACVLNIGNRPTVESGPPELHFEVHLLDYDGDLYGRELEIEFVQFVRTERRFPSLDALRKQIQADVEATRRLPGMGMHLGKSCTTPDGGPEPTIATSPVS